MEEEDSLLSDSDSSDDSYAEDDLGRTGAASNGNHKGFCKGHWSKEEVILNQ